MLSPSAGEPGRFIYADPPYPGHAWRYRNQASFGGEVDHAALIRSLVDQRPTGWALSTSSAALREVLPLCPVGAKVCAWVKPNGAHGAGVCSRWEPLIVVGGRATVTVRDWLLAMPARGGGDLVGRKPLAFCAWLFDVMGMQPGDELVDLFPGSGVVSKAWASLSDQRRCSSNDGRSSTRDVAETR